MGLQKLKKEVCLDRLIWVQPPSFGSDVFLVKKMLNRIGVKDNEIVLITAKQFISKAKSGFAFECLSAKRVLLIDGLSEVLSNERSELFVQLSNHKKIKYRYGLQLVVFSLLGSEMKKIIESDLNDQWLSIFKNDHIIDINEKIHGIIEEASIKYKRPILRLTANSADYLEYLFLKKGEVFLKTAIERGVRLSKDKVLDLKSLDMSRNNETYCSATAKTN